jgi:hypothetical protein
MLEDHEFHPKLGRLQEEPGARPKLFLVQVLAARSSQPCQPLLAGAIPRTSPPSAAWSRRSGLLTLYGNCLRRVIVRAHIVR